MSGTSLALLIALLFFSSCLCQSTQIHTAWTGNPDEIAISWASPQKSQYISAVQYSTNPTSFNTTTKGKNFLFTAGTANEYLISTVVLDSLAKNTKYYYVVGDLSTGNWSHVYSFTTKISGIVYAIYGDFGYNNSQILTQLLSEAKSSEIHAVLHVGDLAYNLNDEDGKTGDLFMQSVEPIAASVPYMTCPGNHERDKNFTQYIKRFDNIVPIGVTSNSNTNLWYSFDQDFVHFVSIDTEIYAYFTDPVQISRQIKWLEADLAKADANRKQVPWIVMFGHKASWMDNTNFTEFGILSHKYKVDLYFCGHSHNYQRLLPYYMDGSRVVVDTKQKKGSKVYTNPLYTTVIVVGSAGGPEGISTGQGPAAARDVYFDLFGFGHLQVYNATHAHWQWEEAKKGVARSGDAVDWKDDLWIEQHNH